MDKDAEGNIKYDEEGEPKFLEGKRDEFLKELEELREIEVDIELIMLNYDDLEKCDSDKYSALTVRDMDVLSIMIE